MLKEHLGTESILDWDNSLLYFRSDRLRKLEAFLPTEPKFNGHEMLDALVSDTSIQETEDFVDWLMELGIQKDEEFRRRLKESCDSDNKENQAAKKKVRAKGA